MTKNIHELISQSAQQYASRPALYFKQQTLTYTELYQGVIAAAIQLQQAEVGRFERVAVYLPKQFETVFGLFAASCAGAVFVPVNPALKAAQVSHILRDCNVRLLITSSERLAALQHELQLCPDLHTVLLTDTAVCDTAAAGHLQIKPFYSQTNAELRQYPHATDADMAAILYTSGSTGKPKGVVLSHRNMLVGAQSVSSYLANSCDDVLLALLPLSFDYGLSQLTTAFLTGASVVLLDFFLVQDVVRTVAQHGVTGIAAVPPLWAQLAKANWTDGTADSVRYLTNSGGAMPQPLLQQLQQIFHNAEPYLMYGLTEAFRSTYLPPADIQQRPGSMGKAIPNAEIVVVREDGSLCGPNEPGELVHRGPLVSLGYWNAPEKTAERFKPDPVAPKGIQLPQLAVFSGDTVRYDEEGYLYFIGRRDEMIKTSGYRVSPTEVEEAVYAVSPELVDVAAIGVPHPELEQAIVVLLACKAGAEPDLAAWQLQLKRSLPNFMQPKVLLLQQTLPKNANGKIDRKLLSEQYRDYFQVSGR
ncbi:MAG: acyl-CoA ligase (AMP-forming), exosortase A system-associated [Gammaproteobacteria bacterium]|nr:acyl-CoA ligase (AMP-forming), exosortase A system-associated [Gammaproteobacteria bacterium]MBU1556048.1 acyl-CoA ligase (AMP-forming), exosortase A system-associated [Gammaproteobacteria bacterium]MBU2069215.1 acyl-CoA ligase (AMP-forming), exosortase A system-associated [Gammaproteobacteria bacterium]MBU2182310.1 acyl-CoA ligase (AMP-forming), exosortase A system-associated [Gammaproteobacteria bacterium]MBU2204918.1 acyl-CoA ligase (AMP-forming), exosortase A system-associated [Gammaprot